MEIGSFSGLRNNLDELSEEVILKEIEYFQDRLEKVTVTGGEKRGQSMRHVYKTLLTHRKRLLNELRNEQNWSNLVVAK